MPRMIVEVAADVDFDQMHPDDVNDNGQCIVDGSYGIFLKNVPSLTHSSDLTEATLTIFHNKIGIACLDDFTITVRNANPHDDPNYDLGDFDYVEPVEGDPEPL